MYRFNGRTVGLLGFGKIARELCWRLKGVGFTVQATDPYVEAEKMAEYGVEKVDLESLFRTSDFVSLHLRVNKETHHIVNEKTLSWMKPEAYVINVSRGALVDERALINALEQRKISGAGLDVLEQEPPPEDHPLLHFPNVTITPHCGACTVETRSQHVHEWAGVIESFLKGHYPLRNQINSEVIPKPVT
jgi:phosphoglycerate dehydrogenase-like enzyme